MLPDRPCTWFAALRLITACCVMIARREAPFVIVLSQIAVLVGWLLLLFVCCLDTSCFGTLYKRHFLSRPRMCCCCTLSLIIVWTVFIRVPSTYVLCNQFVCISYYAHIDSVRFSLSYVMCYSWSASFSRCCFDVMLQFLFFFLSRLSPPCCFFSLESRFLCKYDR